MDWWKSIGCESPRQRTACARRCTCSPCWQLVAHGVAPRACGSINRRARFIAETGSTRPSGLLAARSAISICCAIVPGSLGCKRGVRGGGSRGRYHWVWLSLRRQPCTPRKRERLTFYRFEVGRPAAAHSRNFSKTNNFRCPHKILGMSPRRASAPTVRSHMLVSLATAGRSTRIGSTTATCTAGGAMLSSDIGHPPSISPSVLGVEFVPD
jgi:hypothetical protein